MGYTEKHKDITEAIRDAKGGMRRYCNLIEGSRGTLGCPERGLDMEVFAFGLTAKLSPKA
jgi:hypothetical protein